MKSHLGMDWNAWLGRDRALDPYLIWADATGFAACASLHDETMLPFLIEARAEALTDGGFPLPLGNVKIPRAYQAGEAAAGSRFFTACVPKSSISAMLEEVDLLPRFQLSIARSRGLSTRSFGNPERSATSAAAEASTAAATGAPSTVIGIIDDGCPFAHPNLADELGKTRVRFLWDQGAATALGSEAQSPWTPAGDLERGLEIDGPTLDGYRALGEQKTYPALGIDRVSGRMRIHGSSICHLAAGRRVPVDLSRRRTTEDGASNLPVVFVQLPLSTVADTTGGSIGFHVLDALYYIHARAVELSKTSKPRVVVNLSYGSNAGPHDGTSLAEEAVVAFLDAHENVSLVVAAGNSNREPVHAAFDLPSGGSHTMHVMVGPDHGLETYVEIWWPGNVDLGEITVNLSAPGQAGANISAGLGMMAFDRDSDPTCGVVFSHRVALGRNGTMTLVAMRATRGLHPAPFGPWQIRMQNDGTGDIHGVHVWVERNDIMLGPRRKQQATLILDPAQRSRPGTMALGSLSNVDSEARFGAKNTRYVVVGASRMVDGQRSDYSSTGPTRGSNKRKGSDGLAPADIGPARLGLLVDGAFSGKWTRVGGSSAAAAVATRCIAAGHFESASRDVPSGTDDTMKVRQKSTADSDGWFRVEPSTQP